MDESVLYRLLLARRFLDSAARHLEQTDVHGRAVAVVSAHDALDNFLGALASHLNVHIAEDLTMLRTYDRIGSGGHSLGSRTKVAQLNALRNDVKHLGLSPNPAVVRQLIAEITAFADATAKAFIGRPLSRIQFVDLIREDDVRSSMQKIRALIDSGEYRPALEQMAHVIYRVYESHLFEFTRSLMRHTSNTAPDPEAVDFPQA
ncbi:MAG: hypothetical protein JO231_01460 [Acidobacteria bacterium]|nr:hypothetical protein [Acidobacteriota bacterium]